MSIWKKAVSTLATAGLLASLLGTAVAATASAADVSTFTGTGLQYLANCTPSSCSQVADGYTQLQLTAPTGGNILAGYMTVSGASFAAANGDYRWDSTAGTLTIPAADASTNSNSWIRLKSSTAGTATVSIYSQQDILHAGVLVGTVSVTFYGAGTSGISASASFSKTVVNNVDGNTSCHTTGFTFDNTAATSGAATIGALGGWLCVFVGNSSTTGLASGVGGLSVSASISPVGVLGVTAATGQAVTLDPGTTPGVYFAQIKGSGVGGVATITFSTSTLASGTIALGTQTFTFTGSLAKLTTAAQVAAVSKTGSQAGAVRFKAYDAAGNRLTTTNVTASASTGAPFTVSVSKQTTPTASGWVDVSCNGIEGKGTVTVSFTSTDGLTKVTSNATTVYCSGSAATFTVAFDKTSVAPGGSATLTATALDAAGQPAAGYLFVITDDNNYVLTEGAFVSAGTLFVNPITDGDQGDGTTTWSYLAPFQTGVITASVTDLNTTTSTYTNLGTKYASLVVGTTATTSAVGSALGVTKVGPFTVGTKIAALGKYASIKFSGLTPGALVAIKSTTKTAAGTWPVATVLTSRLADANGNIYLFVRSSVAAWKSYSAGGGWIQVRWR